ncbi:MULTISPECIES: hypothetical protein [unclassified Pseudomonas]|uniref:hypothetical protein n=1 Tax=unclassified Pseudomonas TaxID=196821 RepID=UPI00244BEF8C|nr:MULTISPECIES: hypothetical protein [unclassified Pseudomonas]MDG9927401.1 hypothetical protein [Pseudomonas sp. GD04042]MDH0482470.1 hypothetical protein [Pseudomonas sp. GD04015]MDH0602822.1 hypothetical protein [Pseudomonas sp. GD03869]
MQDSNVQSVAGESAADLEELAETLLANDAFLDRLYEKLRIRETVQSARSADALARAAQELFLATQRVG